MRKRKSKLLRTATGPGISKLEAASRQLATAIQLYFEDRDQISVHTLAMAASEIVYRLCRLRELPRKGDDLINLVPEEYREEVRDALKEPSNFFKHASSGNQEPPLQFFSDETNILAIFIASEGLGLLGEQLPEATVFLHWASIVLGTSPIPKDVQSAFGDIARAPRSQQKQAGLNVLHKAKKYLASKHKDDASLNG
jgi:hypothetical protein